MAHYDQAPDLHPRLVIEGVDEAIAYYETTLGATLLERFADDKNRVVHARIGIGNSHISMTEQIQEWGLLSPRSLQGSAVLIHLTIADCDEIGTRMVENGGEMVIPIANRPWKKREGRIRDPFGHLWILSTPLSMTEPQHLSASG